MKVLVAWCKNETRTPGPGTQDLDTLGPETRDSPQSLKEGTPGPTSKSKSGTFIITFLHCYIYIFPRIVVTLSYILCSKLIHHFCELFNVRLGMPNLVVDGETHATFLAANLPDNS